LVVSMAVLLASCLPLAGSEDVWWWCELLELGLRWICGLAVRSGWVWNGCGFMEMARCRSGSDIFARMLQGYRYKVRVKEEVYLNPAAVFQNISRKESHTPHDRRMRPKLICCTWVGATFYCAFDLLASLIIELCFVKATRELLRYKAGEINSKSAVPGPVSPGHDICHHLRVHGTHSHLRGALSIRFHLGHRPCPISRATASSCT
jgi:hypothetical protein